MTIPDNTTILVVDDEASARMLLVDTLSHIGHKIEVAENGEIALMQAQNLKPDLILLDIMMPGIDGFETLRRLKTNEQNLLTRWLNFSLFIVLIYQTNPCFFSYVQILLFHVQTKK